MPIRIRIAGRSAARALASLLPVAALCGAPAWSHQAWSHQIWGHQDRGQDLRIAQLRLYTAAGTHQCGSGQSCVVSGGGFSSCNDATVALQTRDCCPTTPKRGTSSRFTLNYCIPDRLP
jgi:hypothetical protein